MPMSSTGGSWLSWWSSLFSTDADSATWTTTCCTREKSAERQEYEALRAALAKKQEEVKRLQLELNDAVPTPPRGLDDAHASYQPYNTPP